jgi:hypothetical protein
MATTVSDIINIVNSDIGDDSNDRISESDRINAITEATAWLQEELGNDHQKKIHSFEYTNIKHQYRLDDTIPDLVNATDLRLDVDQHANSFVFKSASEVIQDVQNGVSENSFSIDRFNGKSYLVINYPSSANSETIHSMDSTDDWGVDDDADSLTTDIKEVKQGSASLMFNVDVSKSVNDKATIKSTSAITPSDLTAYDDLAYYFLWVYIPDAVDITSVDLVWGTDSSNYWTDTATTDTYGLSLSNGWNLLEFDWSASSMIGSPDASTVSYYEMSINYSGTQVDDTGFRFDDLRISLTKNMKFHYTSYHVGTDDSGVDLLAFNATTNVPFFSNQYDQYKFAVAHKASSSIFSDLRLFDESDRKLMKAKDAVNKYKRLFPSHKRHESGGFKVSGLNFN